MVKKLASFLYVAASITVGLGAFGHGSQWLRHVESALRGIDPHIHDVLALVWYWVSGAMLVLSFLLLWSWRQMRQGNTTVWVVPLVIAAFYALVGILASIFVGSFFLIFLIQGLLLGWGAWTARSPR
jgi:hypothetical protein